MGTIEKIMILILVFQWQNAKRRHFLSLALGEYAYAMRMECGALFASQNGKGRNLSR
jgi:hypothetical protein